MIISLSRLSRYFFTCLAAIVVIFSIFYISHSYQEILIWYSDDLGDFYRKDVWRTTMFTEGVKSTGNILCIVLSIFLICSLAFLWKKKPGCDTTVKIVWRHTIMDTLVLAIAFVFWWYYQSLAPYAYDEIFSSYHFAAHSAWLSLSYYPLPNNHILYNVLNAFVGGLSGDQFYISGRLISLFAYVITSLLTYRVALSFYKVEWLALLSTILVISQFPIVGFATQARGYSMLIMCAGLATYALWSRKVSAFYLWDVCIVTGMAVMPSFLYYWFGLGLTGLLLFKDDKTNFYSFLRHNFISALIVLSIYLPAISLSGYQSLIANKYVTSTSTGLYDFFQSIFESHYLRGLFNEWFNIGSNTMIGIALLIIWSVSAFYIREESIRRWNLLTLGSILGTMIIIILNQKLPFYRNLSPIAAILWMAICFTFWVAIPKTSYKKTKIIYALIICTLIGFTHYRLHHVLPDQLYYYDVKNTYERHQQCLIKNIINSASVSLDEDAFYWYGLLPKHVLNSHTSTHKSGGIYIALADKKFPISYTLLWECEGYKCYKIPE